jgi:MFS family permease
VTCICNFICAILARDRNRQVGAVHQAFDVTLFKRPEFLLLLGWGMFSMLAYIVLLFSLPNYAQSIGLTPQQGSVIGALLNLGQGLGRPFIGLFSDRTGRINIALLGSFLSGLFCLVIWIFAKSYGVLIFFALLSGVFAGTYWTTIAPVTAEVVGLKILPSALSIVWIFLIVPSTVSEVIGLQLKQPSGNIYLHAQVFTGFMYIGASVCLWFVRAWKIRELEEAHAEAEAVREAEIRDDDAVPKHDAARTTSVHGAASVKSRVQAARGLWAWQRV